MLLEASFVDENEVLREVVIGPLNIQWIEEVKSTAGEKLARIKFNSGDEITFTSPRYEDVLDFIKGMAE